jgi:hypothetical protein
MTEIESHRICSHLLSTLPRYDRDRLEKHLSASGMTMQEFMRHKINESFHEDELAAGDSDMVIELKDEQFVSLVQQGLNNPPPQEKWDFYNAMIYSMDKLAREMLKDPEHAQKIKEIEETYPDKESIVDALRQRDRKAKD